MIVLALALAASPPVILAVGKERREPLTSPTVGTLRWVPSGRLHMGGPLPHGWGAPRSTATVTKGYWVMESEVTQAMWRTVTGSNPAHYAGEASRPVEMVSWCDAVWFANALSTGEGLEPAYHLPPGFGPGMPAAACNVSAPAVTWNQSAGGYRLPIEAEWEWAARGGQEHRYSGSDDVAAVARFRADLSFAWKPRTAPARGLAPNAIGLHDLSGNVWEWCWTAYEGDPEGPPQAEADRGRVVRGGAAEQLPQHIEVTARAAAVAGNTDDFVGFRLVRSAP